MSLTGSLATMSLAEVFGWIGATNRLGVLTVRDDGAETMLDIRRGRVVECAASDPPVLLGQFLLFYGVITEDVLDRAMRTHATQGRRLGDVLMDMGAVSGDTMEELLTAKAEETVLCSFDHPTGSFCFDPQAKNLQAPLKLDMSVADAIARGDQRVKSAAVAAEILHRPGYVLRKTAKTPSAKLSSVWPLRNAYALVDGERGIDEIVLHMHGSEFHVTQRLYQLYVEEFIELVERNEPAPSKKDTAPPDRIDALKGAERLETSAFHEGVIPIALPPELTQHGGKLSFVEKYILTLCDGTRDLRRITAVAPIHAPIVLETVSSLVDRGWLKLRHGAAVREYVE